MTTPPPRMPAIFFGHGNPMYAIEPNRYTEAWRELGASLPRPAAILSVSAHWYIRGTAVTAMAAAHHPRLRRFSPRLIRGPVSGTGGTRLGAPGATAACPGAGGIG